MGITTAVGELGTLTATIEFRDVRGNFFNPDTAAFQLTKVDGTIINSRSFANGSFAGNTVVLTGPDLALDVAGDITRVFSVEGTYSSSEGSGIPFTIEERFIIINQFAQTKG